MGSVMAETRMPVLNIMDMIQVKVLDTVENLQKFTNKTDVGGKYLDKIVYDTDGWIVVAYNKPKGDLPKTGVTEN